MLEVGQPWDRIAPNARSIARVDHSTGNLVLRDLATGGVRPLTTDGSPNDPGHQFPVSSAFSRDGAQIAYEWYFEDEDRAVLRIIGTMEGDARTPRTLYDNREVEGIHPTDWAPDGRWIAVVVLKSEGKT